MDQNSKDLLKNLDRNDFDRIFETKYLIKEYSAEKAKQIKDRYGPENFKKRNQKVLRDFI